MVRQGKKGERGSISIEASISLTLFIFAMLGLLFFIRVSRVQAAVQYSINMAALDISQYTYLYYSTGLYDLEQDIKGSGEQAEEALSDAGNRLDQSVKGVEAIFNAISGTDPGDGESSSSPGDLMDKLKEQAETIETEGKNIVEQIDGLKGLVSQVGDDPISFARSLAALTAGTGLDTVKGRVLGGLFGKSMCQKYIGNGVENGADGWLKGMGVVDGLEGLNFNWSSILGGTSQDVNLVVTYEVKIFPGLYDGLTATFAQSASTRAWLGGDANVKKFEPLPQESESPSPEPSGTPEPSPSPERTNIWDETNNLVKGAAMKELVRSEYEGVGFVSEETGIYGYHATNNTFYNCTAMDVFSASYQKDSGIKSRIKESASKTREKVTRMDSLSTDDGATHTIDPNQPAGVELLVVIPENAADRKEHIQEIANKAAQELNSSQAEGERTVTVSIRVVTGGGNSSKGEGGNAS
ncbi:TadE/TadG family type IV pilus assembly protein [uncultured Flavonifractor sp.]|uniref:TadE/TadG family type IV pilus assembly protein n=1 Tax=uncultured Flavonifractor sp. TaxID=1193534 RepID=UPI00262BD6E1|nr:hypothetical protein [uncultured Flavonifractor sp.]